MFSLVANPGFFFFFFTHPGKCCKTWHKYSNIFLNCKFSIFTWNWIEWPSAVLISYIDMASGHPLPRKLGIQLSSTVISDKQKSAQLISLEKPLAVLWWSAYRTACGKWQNSAWKHVACLLKIVHSFSSAYPSCHRAKMRYTLEWLTAFCRRDTLTFIPMAN